MKVLQVIEALTRGGAERLVVELALEFRRRGIENRVLCLSAPGPWAPQLEACGLYAGCLGKRPGVDLSVVGKLKRAISTIRPDLVHTHLYTANLWVRVAALPWRDWRLVTTLHNVDSWRSGLHVLADQLLSTVPDRFVAVSGAVGDYYAKFGLGAGRVSVIPNGIYSNGRAGRAPFSRPVAVITACGRLVENKGFSVLIGAAALLMARGRDFRLQIIGEGPLRASLEAQVQSAGLDGRVALLGDRDDARDLISDADVFVLPSVTEGLPLVVLEALHSGRPVVVTDLPGLRGVIINGESGIVVPPRSPSSLARAVELLMDNPDSARKLGVIGRARAKQEFSIERTAASYLDLYTQVLA